jgi:hypothetical protein
MLPLSSLSNLILQEASIIEEESWFGEHSEKRKKIILLNEIKCGLGSVLEGSCMDKGIPFGPYTELE